VFFACTDLNKGSFRLLERDPKALFSVAVTRLAEGNRVVWATCQGLSILPTISDANVVIARNYLGAERLAARAEGQAMSREQAVEYALPETPTNAFKDDDPAHTPGARSSRQQRSKTACAKTET
jgi:hypothetical protein